MGKNVLPEAQLGSLPFWRQYLRGFSQCAFQANEITGLIFVVAVLTYSWRMAVFYIASVLIATVVARLVKADRTLLDLGLFGFNSGLMGLAMGNFYEPNTALWVWVACWRSSQRCWRSLWRSCCRSRSWPRRSS